MAGDMPDSARVVDHGSKCHQEVLCWHVVGAEAEVVVVRDAVQSIDSDYVHHLAAFDTDVVEPYCDMAMQETWAVAP